MNGSCLCGQVEFSILDFNGKIYQCFCSLCRKQGGSASNSAALISDKKFIWNKGEKNIKTWQKKTGFTASFCSNCGSPVPNKLRTLNVYWVPVGLLDPGDYQVISNLFMGSKTSWANASEQAMCFETMPELEEFIEIQISN